MILNSVRSQCLAVRLILLPPPGSPGCLKTTHEFAIDVIFSDEGYSTAESQPVLVEDSVAVAKIEYQQVGASMLKALQAGMLQGGHQVMVENRVLANGVNPHLVQGIYRRSETA